MVEKIVKTTFWFTKKGNIRPLSKEVTELSDSFKRITKSAFNTRGVLKETNKTITEMTGNFRKFNMAWLSIMFGGMAIQRTFGRIQSSAVKAFTSVMSTVEGATTNVGKLSAHFEYLKFTIGAAIDNALTPLMPMLMNLIEWATDWVQQHPEATFDAIAGAFIAGSVLAVGGAFFLFLGGVKMLLANLKALGNLKPAELFTSIGKALKGIGLIAGIGLTITATIDAFRILSKDGTTIVEDITMLTKYALGGALIGFYFGGPIGAGIGAAIGTVISMTVSIVDATLELKKAAGDKFKAELWDVIKDVLGNPVNIVLGPGGFIADYVLKARMRISELTAEEADLKPFEELANLTTPQSIEAMQKLWDDETIQNLSNNLNDSLNPAFKDLNKQIDLTNLKIKEGKSDMVFMSEDINTQSIPSWKNLSKELNVGNTELQNIKLSIDAIPFETYKHVYIVTHRVNA